MRGVNGRQEGGEGGRSPVGFLAVHQRRFQPVENLVLVLGVHSRPSGDREDAEHAALLPPQDAPLDQPVEDTFADVLADLAQYVLRLGARPVGAPGEHVVEQRVVDARVVPDDQPALLDLFTLARDVDPPVHGELDDARAGQHEVQGGSIDLELAVLVVCEQQQQILGDEHSA